MFVIFFRTVIIFILLEFVIRLMGKRHMGELEIGEFVTTLMISEIATLPIQDVSIPIVYAIVPISVLMAFEVASSVILTKIPKLKGLVCAGPNVIIDKGKLDQRELRRLRISIEELMSALRQSNVSSISDVNYAIMEQNATITVIPKVESTPPTAKMLSLKCEDPGIPHIIISDGRIARQNLARLNKTESWIDSILKDKKCRLADVFLLTVDDCEKIFLIKKDKK